MRSWKKERGFWKDYMHAYEEAIEATSTENAPWYVIPADKKWFTRVAVSEIIIKKLETMNLQYPQTSDEHRRNLSEAKKLLENEK